MRDLWRTARLAAVEPLHAHHEAAIRTVANEMTGFMTVVALRKAMQLPENDPCKLHANVARHRQPAHPTARGSVHERHRDATQCDLS